MQDEAIYGLTLRDCAEIMAKDGELKAQYGEPAHRAHLQQYLAQRGTDENTWAHAWNGWWTRMEADPSGQLHAKFAMMQQELTLQAHHADVPDQSQYEVEGVSLEKYAEIMARAAGGEDMQALVSEAGFEWGQFQRAQAGWNQAMAEDVNHHLTTQYGQLYAKYTPGFAQQMQGQIAGQMAANHAQRAGGVPDEPEEEYTFAHMQRDMEDPNPKTRWMAAHHVSNQWDIGDHDDPTLAQAARRAVELHLECLQRFDEHSSSEAEAAATDLKMFASEGFLPPAQAEDAKGDLERAHARAQEHLTNLHAAFAPIRDKAVPERVHMQSAIQDFTSLVETLGEVIGEWDDDYQPPSSGGGGSAGSGGGGGAGGGSSALAENDEGFLAILKRLPIIGPILRALGL
ncbi:MAG: hypothetical protein KC583_22985 [Myxococcales bacterium]|nr:hypothetical protein [Myxococcales bacterium]